MSKPCFVPAARKGRVMASLVGLLLAAACGGESGPSPAAWSPLPPDPEIALDGAALAPPPEVAAPVEAP